MSSRDGRDGADLGGLETSETVRTAKLNQVVNYSEFLHELAIQRHTVLRNYSGYPDHAKRVTDPLDALIRDVLRHIEGSDLVNISEEPK